MLVGYLLDHYKAFGHLETGYHLLFTFCGLTYLVVWLVIHLLTRKSKPLTLEQITQ
jgi:ACS family hexuronate transporter-like MFS transporter